MKKIYKITFGMVAALLIAACADDKEFAEFTQPSQSGTTVTVAASMPGDKSVSKIGLAQSDNSLNIISQWQSADEVQIFVSQNGNSYAIGKSTVQNISDDGKSCSFSFELPSEISADAPYNVYGFCGIDGKLENGTISIDAATKRIPLANMKAPCYFVAQPTSANFEAKFNHIGTYEILHVANKSASDITFTHNGYTTSAPWYYNAMHGTLSCGTSATEISSTGVDGEPLSESATIIAGASSSIVSWYLPTGSTLSEAVLNAAINGNAVKSSDTKSSTTIIKEGKAYHLYVTWDGEKLRFGQKVEPEIPVTGDGYVDLGLPSGTLWATCNVGAQNPWDYGDYFAWGETKPKEKYSEETYTYHETTSVLDANHDAATVNMGSNWRMPTKDECKELMDNCDWEWTSDYNGTGVAGEIVWEKSSHSTHIFLPAAGYHHDVSNIDGVISAGTAGLYWSSTPDVDDESWRLYFLSNYLATYISKPLRGQSVRAVYKTKNPTTIEKSYVDLGLPSGTLWATCNIGAENPWDYGDYFAWGETEPKENYDWSTYKYSNGSYNQITKYCSETVYGYNGFTDNLTVLEAQDDAATANWGSNWRMPTQAEFQELYNNCDWEWTSNYNGTGVVGRIVKSRSNSNTLFFPAAGSRDGADSFGAGNRGDYWSSSLHTGSSYLGDGFCFGDDYVLPDGWHDRHYGSSVRPVRCR